MDEQEFKQIAAYIPYGLRVYYDGLCEDDIKGEFTVSAYHVGSGISLMGDQELEDGDLSKSFYVDFDFPIKPILRPLSSITKEEASKLLSKAQGVSVNEDALRVLNNNNNTIIIQYEYLNNVLLCLSLSYTNKSFIATPYAIYGSHKRITTTPMLIYDWFIENHFDVFGLIDRGLAIEKNNKL